MATAVKKKSEAKAPANKSAKPFVRPGYCRTRVPLQLTPRQAAAAKMIACTSSEAGERAHGGRRVAHPEGATVETEADAIRMMLDRAADDLELQLGKSLVSDFGLKFRAG